MPQLDVLDGQERGVVGGGDSALDWSLASVERARGTTLVHRRQQFRAHAHSVKLLQDRPCVTVPEVQVTAVSGDERLESMEVTVQGEDQSRTLPCTLLVAPLGFTMRLGPIAEWALELRDRSILVDSSMRTNLSTCRSTAASAAAATSSRPSRSAPRPS